MKIVVDNLISNAIKYTPEGGVLSLQLKKYGDKVQLDVCDSGPGVAPEDIENIFDAFYRGRSTPNSDIRGSGLGLSIAKEFVAIHRGVLEVINSERTGAHFRVSLPVQLSGGMV